MPRPSPPLLPLWAAPGARHLDLRLAELLAKRFNQRLREQAGDGGASVDVRSDPRAMAKLLAAARKAKEVLSTNTEAAVHVNTLYAGQDYDTTVRTAPFPPLASLHATP